MIKNKEVEFTEYTQIDGIVEKWSWDMGPVWFIHVRDVEGELHMLEDNEFPAEIRSYMAKDIYDEGYKSLVGKHVSIRIQKHLTIWQ